MLFVRETMPMGFCSINMNTLLPASIFVCRYASWCSGVCIAIKSALQNERCESCHETEWMMAASWMFDWLTETIIDKPRIQIALAGISIICPLHQNHNEKEGEDFVTIDFSGQGTETTETGEEKPLDFILDFEGEMPISGIIYFTDNQNNETIDMTKIDVVLENVTSSNGKWCANKNYGEDIVVTRCEE